MNKKFLSALIFTSLFLISTVAIFVQPVAGSTNWKFGVPDAAKGMKLQSEVKVYDKETWGECIGVNPDDRAAQNGEYREGYSPDANNVGARDQSKINDWESTEYWWMGDTLLWTKMDESLRKDASYDRNGDGISDLIYYWDAVDFAEMTIAGFANRTDTVLTGYKSALIKYVQAIAGQLYVGTGGAWMSLANYQLISAVENMAWTSTMNRSEIAAFFNRKYDAKVVERDVWYWQKTAEFESDPDEEDVEAPFIEDPEDLKDSFHYFVQFTEYLFDQIEDIVAAYTTFVGPAGVGSIMTGHTHGDGSNWDHLNTSLWQNLVPALPAQVQYVITTLCMNDAVLGLYQFTKATFEGIIDFFRSKIPDMGEYLIMLFNAGIPAHQPVDKWLEKLVDAFDVDKDYLWNSESDDPFYIDVSVDGLIVTIEKEWADGVLVDPEAAEPEERSDYDMVFTYGDTGGQSSTEYIKGDETFWKVESIAPTIPGFEISILLAAAAISAIGLIFVIMKKRRM